MFMVGKRKAAKTSSNSSLIRQGMYVYLVYQILSDLLWCCLIYQLSIQICLGSVATSGSNIDYVKFRVFFFFFKVLNVPKDVVNLCISC